MTGCVFAGASGPEVCSLCNNRTVGLETAVSAGSSVVYQGDAGEQGQWAEQHTRGSSSVVYQLQYKVPTQNSSSELQPSS